MNEQWGSVCRRDRLVKRVLLVAALVMLALTAFSFGDDRQTVVRIGGCSGVCVDAAGLVLTAKHCGHGPVETVVFLDRSVSARRIYVCEEVEGPVVFDCEGEGFPYQAMADELPKAGSVVSSSGYPNVNGQRVFRRATGKLLYGADMRFQGKPFAANITDMPLLPGWSGGPLLNERGQVCGLLTAANDETSVFISYAATRAAYEAVRPSGQATLYVFSTRTCSSCLKFKADYDGDAEFRQRLQAAYRVEIVDAELRPDLAKQHNIVEVPTFVVPGQLRIQGYPGKQALADRLGQIGQWQPITEPTIDWSHVSIVLLVAEQDVGQVRGAIRSRILEAAVGPLERRVAEATEGKAAFFLVAERTHPEQFALLTQAAGVPIDRFFVLVLVKQQELGLKGVIAGIVEKAIGEQLGSVPVDLIFERVHAADFNRIVGVLNGDFGGLEPGEPEGGFPVQETALGGILAILTERLKLIGKLTTWWQRRKER